MSTTALPPLTPAHLDAPVARAWPPQTPRHPDAPPHAIVNNPDNTTLSYSFDQVQQSLRIVVTDKATGEVLRHIEFKFFHPHLHRTEKLSGLLLDQRA